MEHIKIRNKYDESLSGILHGTIDCSLAIVCHGLADTKENPFLVAICDRLAENGIAAFRFDFSGNGESEGEFIEATYHKETDDLKVVMDWFAAERKVKKFVLVGHSMGGGVVRVAAAGDDRVKALVSLAGVACADTFKEKFPEEYKQILEGKHIFFKEERFGKRFPIDKRYIVSAESIDIMATASRMHCPCLCIIGDQDLQQRREQEREWLDALPDGVMREFILIEGADHTFNRDKEQEEVHRAREELLEALIPWVKAFI